MKKILFFLCIVGICSSCKDFLNLTPKNKVVVYTLEDVKQTMSSYFFAMASNYQSVYFNGEAITFPFDSDIATSFAMYGNDVNMLEWRYYQIRGSIMMIYTRKYRLEGTEFSQSVVETFVSVHRLYE